MIFEPFKQVDNDASKKYGGTGLGLAISRRLVDLMGGEMRVESELNKGTIFKLTFKNIDYSGQKAEREEVQVEYSYNFNKSKILLVEDIFSNREIIKGFLGDANVEIIEAENGEIALTILDSITPELILLDMMMPIKSGFDTAKEIKAKSKFTNVPIIALTALSDDEIPVAEVKYFSDYLRKPINKNQLLETLSKFISSSKRQINMYTIKDKEKFNKEFEKLIVQNIEFTDNEEVMKLSKALFKYAEDNNEPVLSNLAQELKLGCENFDVDEIEKVIKKIYIFLK
jgi:DNA-binding response OmpR family regulator